MDSRASLAQHDNIFEKGQKKTEPPILLNVTYLVSSKKKLEYFIKSCILRIYELEIQKLPSFSGYGQPFPQIPNILSPLTCFPDSSTFVEHHALLALKVG